MSEDNGAKYQIEEKLGDGGFGEVFKARHVELDVLRAIKIPLDQSDELEDMLKGEAKRQAKLEHPNIVRVDDIDRIDGKIAIVMECVAGGSVRDTLDREGKLAIDQAVRYAIQICEALAHAHAMHIVHGDIKPENILLDDAGNVKVVDFGISRLLEKTQEKMSHVMGTIQYMAPEQLDGMADFRSDIWAAGVVLYEMLSGEECFGGGNTGTIVKNICASEHKPLIACRPDVPGPLNAIVDKMLAKDLDERYQKADDVAADLRQCLSGFETLAKAGPHQTEVVGGPVLEADSAAGSGPGAAGGPAGGTTIFRRRWSRVAVVVIVILACASLAYGWRVGIFGDAGGKHASAGLGEIEEGGRNPVPDNILSLPAEEQMAKAGEYMADGDAATAYAVYRAVAGSSGAGRSVREKAAFYAGSTAAQYLGRLDLAEGLLSAFLQDHPASGFADDALYTLGTVYLEQNRLSEAVFQFTRLMGEYPESDRLVEARFMAQKCSAMLVEARDKGEVDKYSLSVMGNILPNNMTSLISFFSALVAPLVWLLISFTGSKEKMTALRTSKKLWLLILLFVGFLAVNYVMNQNRGNQDFKQLVRALEARGIDVGGQPGGGR